MIKLSDYQSEYEDAVKSDISASIDEVNVIEEINRLNSLLLEKKAKLSELQRTGRNHHTRAVLDKIFFNATKGAGYE